MTMRLGVFCLCCFFFILILWRSYCLSVTVPNCSWILFLFLQRDPFLNLITLRSRAMGRLGKSRLEIVFLGHVMGAGAGGAPAKGESCCSPSRAHVFRPFHPAKSAFSAPKHHCSSSHGSFGFNTQRWGSGCWALLGRNPRCWVWLRAGTQTSL